jgi:hypothetical protein
MEGCTAGRDEIERLAGTYLPPDLFEETRVMYIYLPKTIH